MLKKFSFAGVSAGAIALATLCPLPSHALTFRFQFSDGINIGIGEIQGAETGQAFTDSNGTQLIYQAIGDLLTSLQGLNPIPEPIISRILALTPPITMFFLPLNIHLRIIILPAIFHYTFGTISLIIAICGNITILG